MGGVSQNRALRSAESALKGAAKKVRRDDLDRPNDPLPLWSEARGLPMFMAIEHLEEPQERWVTIQSVFPDQNRITDDQVRETSASLIKIATTSGIDALPSLTALFHLGSEWGGEIFGTKDIKALAAYTAMGFTHVPVTVASTHHFIDANLRLPFPTITSPTSRLRMTSARVAQSMGLKSQKTFPFEVRQDRALASLWRIHDCLRDFLLEGELVRDDAARHFTATIKATSLFPWLMDDRLDVIRQAFTVAHPHQARHARVPSTPEGEEWTRRSSLPPSISSDED